MRNLMMWAVLGLFSTTVVLSDAEAKPKKDEAEETEEGAEGDNGFVDVKMIATGSEPLDALFKRSEGPIETVSMVRNDVAEVRTSLLKAMELKEGTPFDDALNNLLERAEGKINVSFDKGVMPSFSAADGMPDTVKPTLDALNASFAKLNDAQGKLEAAGKEMMAVAEEATVLAADPKSLGLKATKIPKALSSSKKNVKSLKTGAEVAQALTSETTTMLGDVKTAFVDKGEPAPVEE